MKDKQTYKTRKEHSTDMSYENETKITTEDNSVLNLTSLIEQHKKDIWEWKQRESQWIRDKNQLDGNKQIIEELSSKLVEMGKANLALKKRAQEAEGETTIVKGIGMNSPEMKALRAKVNELEGTVGSAQDINDNHQRYNGKLQTRLTEVEDDNKSLSKQIEHLTNRKT
jgi:DNA repair exonuclease SbcCD ATPase subunit